MLQPLRSLFRARTEQSNTPLRLVVGLGNPGPEYARNRHNIGFLAVDAIAERYGARTFRRRHNGLVAEARIGGGRVLILKPMTYMNESGRAVGEAARFYRIGVADVTVFHDEIDLPVGRLRVRVGGGIAGHNGLRSIRAHIGDGFRRVRIGVGRPEGSGSVTKHVLGDFGKQDSEWRDQLLSRICEHVPRLLEGENDRFASLVAQPRKESRTLRDSGRRVETE